jgi:hypothetical protein
VFANGDKLTTPAIKNFFENLKTNPPPLSPLQSEEQFYRPITASHSLPLKVFKNFGTCEKIFNAALCGGLHRDSLQWRNAPYKGKFLDGVLSF